MRSHRRIVSKLRALALGLGAVALLGPAAASAKPALDAATTTPPQAKVGDTPADVAVGQRYTALAGWYAASQSRAGDTPADHPGASREPEVPPTTVEIVRPERIVQDADEALPIALAGTAMLIALGSAGLALVRTRSPQGRPTT